MKATMLAMALALATGGAHAATVLEYDVEGRCETDFTRMVFDGLHARIDSAAGGSAMTTLFDDGEQLMHMLMHDSRNVMTMESDDDAIDFQSDVGRSSMLYSSNQVEKLTGMDSNAMMAQAQQMMAQACPELAEIGFSDPDYAAAAERCSKTMGAQAGVADARMQKDMLRAMQGKGPAPKRAPPSQPARWSTTQTERGDATRVVAGLECTDERTLRGDTVLREQCVVALDALALDAAATRRLKRIMKVGQGMSAGISELHPEMNADRDAPPSAPLERTCYEGGERTGRATLRIARDAASDPSLFVVPTGYEPLQITPPDDGR